MEGAPWDDRQHPIMGYAISAGAQSQNPSEDCEGRLAEGSREGMTGAAVATVMRDAGLTHGGFYKHFASKDELLLESLHLGIPGDGRCSIAAAEKSKPKAAWKAVVKRYLSPEHCDHIECGCPLAALAPELARAEKGMKVRSLGSSSNIRGECFPGCRADGLPRKNAHFLRFFRR